MTSFLIGENCPKAFEKQRHIRKIDALLVLFTTYSRKTRRRRLLFHSKCEETNFVYVAVAAFYCFILDRLRLFDNRHGNKNLLIFNQTELCSGDPNQNCLASSEVLRLRCLNRPFFLVFSRTYLFCSTI